VILVLIDKNDNSSTIQKKVKSFHQTFHEGEIYLRDKEESIKLLE
jgi:hypothetical protein